MEDTELIPIEKIVWICLRVIGLYYLIQFLLKLPVLINSGIVSCLLIGDSSPLKPAIVSSMFGPLVSLSLCIYFLRYGNTAYKLLYNSSEKYDFRTNTSMILALSVKCLGIVVLITAFVRLFGYFYGVYIYNLILDQDASATHKKILSGAFVTLMINMVIYISVGLFLFMKPLVLSKRIRIARGELENVGQGVNNNESA